MQSKGTKPYRAFASQHALPGNSHRTLSTTRPRKSTFLQFGTNESPSISAISPKTCIFHFITIEKGNPELSSPLNREPSLGLRIGITNAGSTRARLAEHQKMHLSVGGGAGPVVGNGPVYPLPFLEHDRPGERASQGSPKQALLRNRIRPKSNQSINQTHLQTIDEFRPPKDFGGSFGELPELGC